MEKNAAIITSLLMLIIGFGAGYTIAENNAPQAGSHRMADGAYMDDGSMGMGSAMDDMMSGLAGKKGDAFDEAFLEEMIVHHQGAVEMAEAALTDSKHAELKQMAQGIITAQNAEIAQMQSWLSTWYGIR